MKRNENHVNILVLDEAELNLVGGRIVGGVSFQDALYMSAAAAALLGPALGYCYWLMNPANRRTCWSIFMSNFNRQTVASITQAAATASTTPVSARDDLAQVASTLTGSGSASTIFQSCLNILDDPNEV